MLTIQWAIALVLASAASCKQPADTTGPLETQPPTATALLAEAQRLEQEGKAAAAQEAATAALRIEPTLADAFYWRGRARFRLDQMDLAVRDFDDYIKARPRMASRQWERGIALYYAGRFADGAAQFQLYQSYHDNDVENSVWKFLCMARHQTVAAAREAMLPIKNDPRIPMMEIYRLYQGRSSPQQVLEAVGQGQPSAAELRGRQFYARLYLGLYFEAMGSDDEAAKYLRLAAGEHSVADRINGFMWAVADVHAKRLDRRRAAADR